MAQLEANVGARATEFMQEKSAPKIPKTKLQPTFDYIFQQISVMSVLSDRTFRLILTTWWEKTTQVCCHLADFVGVNIFMQLLHAMLLNQAIGADSKTAKAGQSLSMKLAEQFLEVRRRMACEINLA